VAYTVNRRVARCVPKTEAITCTRMVARCVPRQEAYEVCKLVPQTVCPTAPACSTCGVGGGCADGSCGYTGPTDATQPLTPSPEPETEPRTFAPVGPQT
jgi:hypothetical protein